MEVQLSASLGAVLDGAESVEIDGFMALAGGFSRETFKFDASIQNGSTTTELPMILRKDPPAAVAILETSRLVEHNLLEALRANSGLAISRSCCAEMDPAVFGEWADLGPVQRWSRC